MNASWMAKLVTVLCSVAMTGNLFAQTTVYAETYFGLTRAHTEPKLVATDRLGGGAIAGTVGGAFYVRKINILGQEVWRTKGKHPYFPVVPTKLEYCSNGDLVIACSITSFEFGGLLVARISGTDGAIQWLITRREDEYIDADSVGGTSDRTYLLYHGRPDIWVEAIDATGTSLWTQFLPAASQEKPSATVDRDGNWVVAAQSATNSFVLDTMAYDANGQRTLLHSEAIGALARAGAVIQDGDSFLIAYRGDDSGNGGIYRFTGPITTWRTPLPTLQVVQRVDIRNDNLYLMTGLHNTGRINVISLESGALRWFKGATGMFGIGPADSGDYGYIRDGFARLSTPGGTSRWSVPLGIDSWNTTPRGFPTTTGSFFVTARDDHEEPKAEKVVRLGQEDGHLISSELLHVRGSGSLAVALSPRQDGSTALFDPAYPSPGCGFRVLSSDGLDSQQTPLDTADGLPIQDTDGNFLAYFSFDGSYFVQKLDSNGLPIFTLEADDYAKMMAGQDSNIFVQLSHPNYMLMKLNPEGQELWRRPMQRAQIYYFRDGGLSISFAEYNSVTQTYKMTWLDNAGTFLFQRPDIWIVSYRKDGSYYLAKRSSSRQLAVEYRDAQHRFMWERQVPEEIGWGVVKAGLTDRDGNAIFVWNIDRYIWGAASYDSHGNLRWHKRFEGEMASMVALLRGKDLVVVGEPSHALGNPDLACRIVPNQVGGQDHRLQIVSPVTEEANELSTDFAGNIFVGGHSGGRALVWRIGSRGTMATLTNLTVTGGTMLEGNLANLTASDDSHITMMSGAGSNTGSIEVQARFPAESTGELDGMVEHSCSRSGMVIDVRMRSEPSGTWRLMGGAVSDSVDSRMGFWLPIADVLDHQGAVRLRAKWQPINDEDPTQEMWTARLDLVGLHNTPPE